MTTRSLTAGMLAVALLAAPGVATVQGAPVCGTFEVIPGPDTTAGHATLKAVAALEGSAWAIGTLRKDASASPYPFVARLAADGWEFESTPDLSHLAEATFESIDAARLAGSWVVGHHRDKSSGLNAPLVLSLDGPFWKQMTVTMNGAVKGAVLRDVVVLARNDVWAVGDATEPFSATTTPFVARYDGNEWTEVAIGGDPGRLVAIAQADGQKAWAVGHEIVASSTTIARIAHFDGSAWTAIQHPAMRPGTSLNDVVAIAADDVWAVGTDGTSGLFLHWNGVQWSEHTVLNGADPVSVAGVSGDDVWAVGRSAYYHFDGQSWMTVPITNKPGQSVRTGMDVVGRCAVWTVGSFVDGQREFPLVERMKDPAVPQAPPAPVGVTATALAYNKAQVEWQHAGGATTFLVERCDDEAGACDLGSAAAYTVVAKVPAGTSGRSLHVDTPIKADRYFTYRVRAVNGAGESESSASATVRTPSAPLPSPNPDVVPVPPTTNAPGSGGASDPGPDTVPAPPTSATPARIRSPRRRRRRRTPVRTPSRRPRRRRRTPDRIRSPCPFRPRRSRARRPRRSRPRRSSRIRFRPSALTS